MFFKFFAELRAARVPVSLKELLTLLEALDKGVIAPSVDEFYHLSRTILVKDERHFDRFDRVFAHVFKGVETLAQGFEAAIPEEWLRALVQNHLTDEEKAQIQSLGGWDKLMQTLAERLKEQQERHQGGNKWIGTGGTSPFGHSGYNPEGVRIGGESRHKRAVKVWEKREFKNLDADEKLSARNIKIALRRLRRFAREGEPRELDLDQTIHATAARGYLDVHMRPERRNAVKVLLFLDVGGSMDPYAKLCAELFFAARAEFKRLEHFYFHNCLYESVWKDNRRRWDERTPTWNILHTFPHDYKIVFVGDALMSPYEITYPGGSVEHMNEESGAVWLKRIVDLYPHFVWLNPTPEHSWGQHSIALIRDVIGKDRMFPLTLQGVDGAMRALSR